MNDPGTDSQLEAGRRKLRLRKRWVFGLWLGFIPVNIAVHLGLKALFGAGSQALSVPFSLVYLLTFGVAGLLLSGAPCPRCQEPFFIRTSPNLTGSFRLWEQGGSLLAVRCVHCALPL